jgi:hypothetical protein
MKVEDLLPIAKRGLVKLGVFEGPGNDDTQYYYRSLRIIYFEKRGDKWDITIAYDDYYAGNPRRNVLTIDDRTGEIDKMTTA